MTTRGLAFVSLVLLAACGREPPPSEIDASPGGAYLKVYAMGFVEAMRSGGTEAGAFEMSRAPESDGLYHLGVDVTRDGETRRLTVKLRPDAGGLKVAAAALGDDEVYPEPTGAWRGIDAWHASADRRADEESR